MRYYKIYVDEFPEFVTDDWDTAKEKYEEFVEAGASATLFSVQELYSQVNMDD
jgi:hypothetical protein